MCIVILTHLYFLPPCLTQCILLLGPGTEPNSGLASGPGWVSPQRPAKDHLMRAPDNQDLMMTIWFSWLKPRPERLMKNIQHSNTPVCQQILFTRELFWIIFKVEKENNNIKGKNCQKKNVLQINKKYNSGPKGMTWDEHNPHCHKSVPPYP